MKKNTVVDEDRDFNKSKKKKQIGFLTAMILAVGTTIGAGIFFKNRTVLLSNTIEGQLGLNIAFSMVSWVISIIGILMIAVALIELNSASRDNKGILTWIRNFTKPYVSKISSTYWYLFYVPINVMALSLFIMQAFQDSFSEAGVAIPLNGYLISLIAFVLFLWLLMTSYFSIRTSGYLQWIFAITGNFVPMILVPIVSIFLASKNSFIDGGAANSAIKALPGIEGMNRFFGIGLAIPAIMFSFDGFYTITSLRSNMKEPKKVSTIMLIALIMVSIMYLGVTISVALASTDGTVLGINIASISIHLKLFIVSIIGISVLSTLNGYTIATAPQIEVSYLEKDIWFVWVTMFIIKKILKINSTKLLSFLMFIFLSLVFYLIVTPLGLHLYRFNVNEDILNGFTNRYGKDTIYLYDLIDVMSSFTSIIAYLIIGISMLGGIINRRKNFIETKRNKWFLPTAWISLIFTLSVVILYIIGNLINVIILGVKNDSSFQKSLIGFLFFLTTIIVPNLIVLIEMWFTKKKGDPFLVIEASFGRFLTNYEKMVENRRSKKQR